jgi:hypothetical protein
MQQKHREVAAHFGHQPEQVIRAAQERQIEEERPEQKHQSVESALTYAREKNLERHAVADERELMRDALKRSMGEASFAEVRQQFENRAHSGDLIQVENRSPSRAFTTQEMIGYERDNITEMRAGQNRHEPMVGSEKWREVEQKTRASQHKPTRSGRADRIEPGQDHGPGGCGRRGENYFISCRARSRRAGRLQSARACAHVARSAQAGRIGHRVRNLAAASSPRGAA